MMRSLFLVLVTISLNAQTPTVKDAQAFMDRAEADLLKLSIDSQRTEWVLENFINNDTEQIAAQSNERLIARATELVLAARRFSGLQLPAALARKFLLLKLFLGMPAPNDAKLREELTVVAASLSGTYGKGKYCPGGPKEKCYGIDDLDEQMVTLRDPKKLAEIWAGWHSIGPPMRDNYARFVELSNQGARELGFPDTGDLWRAGYDMSPAAFSADLERLWKQVEPLYKELHAYTRRKLIAKYGAAAQRKDGMIPAHLLGNMWAQEWGNVYDLAAPPDSAATFNLGEIMTERKSTARQVVEFGENFFVSLGFEKMPETFWQRSLIARPADREVVCHASAWDIDMDKDVRLKMCIHNTSEDFITVHHELGHVYYNLAYRTLPMLFRNGANDGFHEAIGDAVALSITPEYLKRIGMIQTVPPASADLPLLLRTAMDKIAFLPFGLLIDKWRWEVFSGQVKPEGYNKAWWRLREQYQGVAPPVDRTDADFDPGAKYHIPANTPYARYFLARIYQFQFYRAMCKVSGYTGPLNRCTFFDSKEAGAKLKAMLELGQSKPWPEALKAMTGEDKADASAMVEYFQPLLVWLKDQNKGETLGWTLPVDPLKAQ